MALPHDLLDSTSVGQPLLECTELRRHFGTRLALDGVSFSVRPGETYGLLGPNGAGKTTTIRLVCGLLRLDAGSVKIAGVLVDDGASAVKAQIGYVPQDVALYPDLTVRENLKFFGRLYAMPRHDLDRRLPEVLQLIGLTERADDRVESLSGGMRRRLNIGAALVHSPTLLVLDEPTVGVDPQSRHAIMESVQRFGREGMAVLYTTHYMEEAERLCDRIGIIDHGRLIAEGTPRELVELVGERDQLDLTADGALDTFVKDVRGLPGIERADVTDHGVKVIAAGGRSLLPELLSRAERGMVRVRSVAVAEPDLEAVFLHLTGTALRE